MKAISRLIITALLADLHTHGLGRYDTRSARASDIVRMARLHGASGTGAILPTVYPGPVHGMRGALMAIKEAMAARPGKNAARVLGAGLEGPFLNPRMHGALDRGFLTRPSVETLKRIVTGFEDVIRTITVAPELPGALRIIEKCTEMGIRVNMGHSDATFAQAQDGKKAGATGVTHLFNAMRHFHHREAGIAGFALLDSDLYVEIIGDGVHLSPETLRLVFRVKRPERIIVVSDSVQGRRGRPVMKGGTLQGGGLSLAECASVLAGIGIPDDSIVKAVSKNPLRYLR